MMILGKLFWINVSFFCAYILSSIFSIFFGNIFLFHFIQSVTILIIVLPLTGMNLTTVIEKFTEQKFDLLEKLNIAAITSLIFLPFLLTFEYSQFGILSKNLPLINALVIFLIAIKYSPFSLETLGLKHFFSEVFTSSFVVSFFLYLILILSIATAFYPLPDSDPYYWLSTLQQEFSANAITTINLYRPLFSSFVYIFHITANVDFYAFLKYVFPFFTLLVLLPTALVARLFSKRAEQITIFLLPLASASSILYFQMPIPQAIINICTTFFIFFLLYAWFAKKEFFYFFAGVFIFTAYFYHEIAILIFLPWAIVALFQHYKAFTKIVFTHKLLATLLIILLFIYNAYFISPIYGFIASWFIRIAPLINWHTNFLFPMVYVNIDGNAVGWGSWFGVIEYYAFYAGPAAFMTIGIFVSFLWSSELRGAVFEQWRKSKEFFTLSIIFLLFFIIAEIFPRLFSVALLPERSLSFAGLFLLAFIPVYFKYSAKKHAWLTLLLIGAIFITCGAAIYTNSLKKYLITPAQVSSAEWIKHNLPKGVFFAQTSNRTVITIFSQSQLIEIPDQIFYTDISIFNANLKSFLWQQEVLPPKYQQPIYIYYSRASDKNPYANRPYFKDTQSNPTAFVFDEHPDRFRRLYAAPNDEVIIWQLTQQ